MKSQYLVIQQESYSGKSEIIRSWRVRFYEVLAEILFIFLARIFKYRKAVIHRNLRMSFTGISREREKELVNSYYRHLADLMIEPFLINNLKVKDIPNFVSYENIQLLNRLHQSGKDILLMASHYGNWEYLLTIPLITNYEVIAVYSPINNSVINRYMLKLRSRFGVLLIQKADWYRTVLNRAGGKPRIYVMVADQRPVAPFKKSVQFLGQETFVQSGCERISQKLNCAVLYADVEKIARHRYNFKFRLMSEDNSDRRSGIVLKQYYEALEETVARNPSNWLWSHDRWKNHK